MCVNEKLIGALWGPTGDAEAAGSRAAEAEARAEAAHKLVARLEDDLVAAQATGTQTHGEDTAGHRRSASSTSQTEGAGDLECTLFPTSGSPLAKCLVVS